MWNDLKPITEETGQRILSAVSGVDAQGQTSGWNNLKPMTEETGRKIVDAVAQNRLSNQEALDNRIKKFYTGNLGAVNITDSDDGAVRDLVIGGRSEQISTNGYQLLNANVFVASSEYNGRKIVNNGDGSFTVTVSSDASDVTNLTPPNNPFFDVSPGTTYLCSGVENGCGIAVALYDKDKKITRYAGSTASNGTFTTSDDEVFLRLFVQSSSVVAGIYTDRKSVV